MSDNFWQRLTKPFSVLAPMEGVTDTVFRQMLVRFGKPDVFFTEFTSVDGICSEGFRKAEEKLMFIDAERPIVAQIWGSEPEKFYRAAKILSGSCLPAGRFDGVDINMGCPVRDVLKQGGGGGLICDYTRVGEIIRAVKEGGKDLPVSVKTRIGRRKTETEEWIGFLLKQGLAAITIHGRTVAELSKVPAHWEEIGKAVKLKEWLGSSTLIIGNGDVKSRDEAIEKAGKFGSDGVMIGRGVFDNPAIFRTDGRQPAVEEKLKLLSDHAELFEKTWSGKKNFSEFRKYIKFYVREFDGATKLRNKLMKAETAGEIADIIRKPGCR